MKKEYNTPEWELQLFSFEDIMSKGGVNVSENETGGSGHNDDNNDEW